MIGFDANAALSRALRLAAACLGSSVVLGILLRNLLRMRRRALLWNKLPGLAHVARQGHVLGALVGEDVIPRGKAVTPENFRRGILRGMRESLRKDDSLRRQGIVAVHYFNERLSRALPVHNMHVLVVHKMEYIREILAAKNQHKFAKGRSYEVFEPLLGHGVLSSSGEWWHQQRRVLDLAFKDRLVNRTVPIMNATTDKLVAKLKAVEATGGTINMTEELLKLTMDGLGHFALSHEFGSLEAATSDDAIFYNAFEVILSTLNTRVFVPPAQATRNLPFAANREFDAAMAILRRECKKIMTRRALELTQRRKDGVEPRDLLDVMLLGQVTDADGSRRPLTSKEALDNMFSVVFAGHDTTAALLTFAVYLLSTCDQRIVNKLHAELDAELGPDGALSPESMNRLPYLDAIVTEALRLYPSALFTRKVLEDIELGGFVIPEGSELFVWPQLTQRDPDNFDDPDAFIPERWTDRLREDGRPLKIEMALLGREMAYLPFSMGPRNCVGRAFAIAETKAVLVRLLRVFDFQHVPDQDFSPDPVLNVTFNAAPMRMRPVLRVRGGGST
ncbi:Cytochrome P450 4e3 [Hondaea fermentalgiana]|uniref:Cytochrome P450 4e3 n=1 Tax=Hondaea fermentalgiana TaxID=2315210 RepID=A0A2R5GH00_9STRA|nr:Cytochrome P450 4e3 [Hondaea fermentalgiana]|eukprot:GBG30167.1 Cytochrome P450 4e3 [Hondaea fermentalgiana]